jgi:hypothetical protein
MRKRADSHVRANSLVSLSQKDFVPRLRSMPNPLLWLVTFWIMEPSPNNDVVTTFWMECHGALVSQKKHVYPCRFRVASHSCRICVESGSSHAESMSNPSNPRRIGRIRVEPCRIHVESVSNHEFDTDSTQIRHGLDTVSTWIRHGPTWIRHRFDIRGFSFTKNGSQWITSKTLEESARLPLKNCPPKPKTLLATLAPKDPTKHLETPSMMLLSFVAMTVHLLEYLVTNWGTRCHRVSQPRPTLHPTQTHRPLF